MVVPPSLGMLKKHKVGLFWTSTRDHMFVCCKKTKTTRMWVISEYFFWFFFWAQLKILLQENEKENNHIGKTSEVQGEIKKECSSWA